MTEPVDPAVPANPPPYSLGAIKSPPDVRDWPIDLLYASLPGAPVDASAISSYIIPGKLPPVLDQGTTPECVAYSQSTLKAYEDLKDQGSFNFDENLFFSRIGGTANGAVTRVGLQQILRVGYPLVGNASAASSHKIAAYYSVPVNEDAVKAAVLNFGLVTIVLPWYNSWFRPVNGVLPAPDWHVGDHEIDVIGWDSRGAHLRQSWGTYFGIDGDCWMPWAYFGRVYEAWKAVDQVMVPPVSTGYRIHLEPHATVMAATLKASGTTSCIASWATSTWGPVASGANSNAPEVRRGCISGQATIVYVLDGHYAKSRLRIGNGVSVYKL